MNLTVEELIKELQKYDPKATVDVKSWGFYYPVIKVENLSFDKYGVVIYINEDK